MKNKIINRRLNTLAKIKACITVLKNNKIRYPKIDLDTTPTKKLSGIYSMLKGLYYEEKRKARSSSLREG